MTSEVGNTLNGGVKPRSRREKGEQNKFTKAMKLLGEDNLVTLFDLQVDTAMNHPDKVLKNSAQQFLLNKVLPNLSPLPHSRYVNIDLLPMNCMEDIKENENIIRQHICDSAISLEEGEKLFAITEQARKTYEATEIAKMLIEMDNRMKENGI